MGAVLNSLALPRGRDKTLERMLADSTLPRDIDPRAVPEGGEGALLLTGAAGPLGRRIHEALVRAGHRVVCVAGTLEQAEPRYAALCDEVSAVVHCAEAGDWSQRYEALRAPNVLATLELLRFATQGRRKAFHFVSSTAALYSSQGQRRLREADTADPAGMHLGYAQSKWVGEALVGEAALRGLAASIHRPALLEPFFAPAIRGCIALGAAPDVAWRIDACPVDFAAAAIARLVTGGAPGLPVAHLVNPRPGYWQEALLWMRLRGYRLRLLPLGEWLALAERESRDPAHPLHELRGFLLDRPAEAGGRYLPEMLAEPQAPRVDDDATRRALDALGLACPRFGAGLLEAWFDEYVESGFLPPRAARAASPMTVDDFIPRLEGVLRGYFSDPGLAIESARPFRLRGEPGMLGELASWRSGCALGLRGYALELTSSAGETRALEVVVKPRPGDAPALEVACEAAALCGAQLGEAVAAHVARTWLSGAAAREIALYSSGEAAITAHAPAAFGVFEAPGQRALVLEHVRELALNDPLGAQGRWRREHIETALAGITQVHAAWYRREDELLAAGWLGPLPDCAAAQPLWLELAEHARPWLSRVAGAYAARRIRDLARTAPARAAALREMPRTLAHHDFNPRNIGLRPRAPGRVVNGAGHALCALDWELATLAVPQRDLAELLCFVLAPGVPADALWRYVGLHRAMLERATGAAVERSAWLEGFRLALEDFAVQRLTLHVMAERLRARGFLVPVAQTWARLMTITDARAPRLAA